MGNITGGGELPTTSFVGWNSDPDPNPIFKLDFENNTVSKTMNVVADD